MAPVLLGAGALVDVEPGVMMLELEGVVVATPTALMPWLTSVGVLALALGAAEDGVPTIPGTGGPNALIGSEPVVDGLVVNAPSPTPVSEPVPQLPAAARVAISAAATQDEVRTRRVELGDTVVLAM